MRLVFLPAYSPDLNPIKEAFSAIPAWIWKNTDYVIGELTGREQGDPYKMIWDAVFSVTPEKALGWFQHSSYIAWSSYVVIQRMLVTIAVPVYPQRLFARMHQAEAQHRSWDGITIRGAITDGTKLSPSLQKIEPTYCYEISCNGYLSHQLSKMLDIDQQLWWQWNHCL